jgi:hypothetical protein
MTTRFEGPAPPKRERRPGTGGALVSKRRSDSKTKVSRQPSVKLIRAGNDFLAPKRFAEAAAHYQPPPTAPGHLPNRP